MGAMFSGPPKQPKLPPPPPPPAPVDREIDQAVTDARKKKAGQLATAAGYQSTILTGLGGAAGNGTGAPVTGGKTLLGQ